MAFKYAVLTLLAFCAVDAALARQLQQLNAFCPDGCKATGCIQDTTQAGLRCQSCQGNLLVNKVTGRCSCVAGFYVEGTTPTCLTCPKGSYCTGKDFIYGDLPVKESCPANMTTLGLRSKSISNCVNFPGNAYFFDATTNTAAAIPCPEDTYSPGLKKQRACVPCPTGYSTIGKTGAKSPNECLIPAGFYLKAPGQVAPCPKGEWKAGTGPSGNCTKCAFGVTTLKEGSTSEADCKAVVAGYYAYTLSSGIVKATKVCPQKYWCPGGIPNAVFNPSNPAALSASEPTIKVCEKGMWTQDVGSISADQCLTPPGFFTNATTTAICPDGSFRADWKPVGEAPSCTVCGEGIFAEKTDQITVFDIINYEQTKLPVTSSSDDCYISPGQGLYYGSSTGTWRAKNCNSDNYGVSNRTYGLTPAACRDCPNGQVASTNASFTTSAAYFVTNSDGTSGFISVKACVNKPGYGYDGRVSQPCREGTYNSADTYGNCRACPYGTTTAGVGAGVSLSDCGIAQGYGLHDGAIRPCPIGTYNNATYTPSTTAACSGCPTGTTTSAEGADSVEMCNRCLPGYGGAGCSTPCGGAVASYGIAGRAIDSPCTACTTQTTGYSFSWQFGNDLYISPAIAKLGASVATDCMAKFGQLVDGSWYLPVQSQKEVTNTTVSNFAACVDLCVEPCEFVTFNYRTNVCSVRNGVAPVLSGAPMIAFKALVSGDVGTNAWSTDKMPRAQAKGAVSSGRYTFYQEPNALDVGVQETFPGAGSFTAIQDCINACDEDQYCAGFTMLMNVAVRDRPTTCASIKGDSSVGQFLRTVTRADTARTNVPVLV